MITDPKDRVPNFPTPDFLRIRATFIAIFSHFTTEEEMRYLLGSRYYVAEIARFLVHFFFFFILLEIDPAGSSFSGEIFLSPTWIQESYFESRTSGERRRSVKYFKVSMWDFLNCSPSGIEMNAEVEEFWWMLCAEFQWFEDIWRMWRWMESSVAGWKLWEILAFYGPVLFIR